MNESEDRRDRLERLAAIREESDTSDIPELTPDQWTAAQTGSFNPEPVVKKTTGPARD